MFCEICEVKRVEKEMSLKEKELNWLREELFDCLIGSERAIAIQKQIEELSQ